MSGKNNDVNLGVNRTHMAMEIGKQLPTMSRLGILYSARIGQDIGRHLTTRYLVTWYHWVDEKVIDLYVIGIQSRADKEPRYHHPRNRH